MSKINFVEFILSFHFNRIHNLICNIFVFACVTRTDSAFTERILGMPNENYKGYVEADATQRARHIPSNSFFLLHGMADVTAPYLHGVQLAHSLTDAGIIFRYQVSFRRSNECNVE